MAIQYPISLPAAPNVRAATWHGASATAVTESPFDGSQQVQSYDAQRLMVECDLPPMSRAEAEEWVAALLSLYGAYGTCLFGETSHSAPRGSAAGPAYVYGANQAGRVLTTRGWAPSTANTLRPGDWLQIAKNQLSNPQGMDDAAWFKGNCSVTATNIVAPDGSASAERITPNAATTDAFVSQTMTPAKVVGPTWNFRVWLKAATGAPSIKMSIFNQASVERITQSITLSTSWQRFLLTGIMPAGDTGLIAVIGGSASWPEADGAIDVWGASVYSPQVDARLHKALAAMDTDANGQGSADLYPALHEPPQEFSEVITTSPKGEFRLAADEFIWTIDSAIKYGIRFTLMEAY